MSLSGAVQHPVVFHLLVPSHTASPLQAIAHFTNPSTVPAHCILHTAMSVVTVAVNVGFD